MLGNLGLAALRAAAERWLGSTRKPEALFQPQPAADHAAGFVHTGTVFA